MRASVLLALLILSGTGITPAFSQDVDGLIEGAVVDASGQPLVNQRVELRSNRTDLRQVATTDANGQFAYAGLRADRYEVELVIGGRVVAKSGPIELSGETMRVRNVTLARPALPLPRPTLPPALLRVSAKQLLDGQPVPTSFEALPSFLGSGHEVIVTDEAGHSMRGRISSISSSRLVLVGFRPRVERAFPKDSVRTIRIVDPTTNGALIGAAFAAAFVLGINRAERNLPPGNSLKGLGTVVGALLAFPVCIAIGHSNDLSTNEPIYDRQPQTPVTISPMLARERIGVIARVHF